MESPVLYILAGCVAAFVIGQSVFFLVKAWREGKRIGMDTKVLKKAAFSGGVFTIVPSLSILFAFLAMQGTLGMVLPWIRLSVLGAVTYEVPAATAAVEASGMTFGQPLTGQVFTSVAWVMTLGCITPLIIIPLFLKKILGGVDKIKEKDSKWGEIFMNALFLGMIAAFLSMGVSGEKPLLSWMVLLSSAVIMALCGLVMKLTGWKWLEHFALPISMLGAMALTLLYVQILPANLLPQDIFQLAGGVAETVEGVIP
ncbi:MAG: DUF5058 family protein [Clostridiales bacterium]|nr:DUF5058 family protein [Clostridiales bacterium]